MAFIYDLTDTWNAGGTTFNAIKMNVTDTASAAASKLITVQVSGTEKFSVKKDGVGYFAGNVGIGTVSPSRALEIDVAGTSALRLTDSSTPTTYAEIISANGTLSLSADGGNAVGSSNIQFDVDGSELMRLNSTGLGIGTAPPAQKIHAADAGTTYVRAENTTTGVISDFGTSSTGTTILNRSNDPIVFYTNTTERMRIDSSGNVAIGGTTANARLEVMAPSTTSSDIAFFSNSNGAHKALFRLDAQGDGELVLRDAGNNEDVVITAGGDSYFNGGNVGIGTASPDQLLHLSANNSATLRFESTKTSVAADDVMGAIEWEGNDGTTGSSGVVGKIDYIAEDATPEYAMRFFTHDNLAGVADFAERLRITSAGNVGIGTSSPDAKLHVSGDTFFVNTVAGRGFQLKTIASSNGRSDNAVQYSAGDASSAEHTWGYGGAASFTERMRLDASGRLGIGTTSPSNPLDIEASTATVDINMTNTANRAEINLQESGTTKGILQYRGSTNAALPGTMRIGTQGSDDLIFNTGGAERMRVLGTSGLLVGKTADNTTDDGHVLGDGGYLYTTRNGNICHVLNRRGTEGDIVQYRNDNVTVGSVSIAASSTSYNTSSDYRLKDIDGPVANSGAYIDALKPVQGSWKADGSRFIGLLAHEVQEVSETQIATGEKDGEEMQAMDYSSPELIANLIAEIQSLRARVAQLEG